MIAPQFSLVSDPTHTLFAMLSTRDAPQTARNVAVAPATATGKQYIISVTEVDKAKAIAWTKALADVGRHNVDVDITLINADYGMPCFKQAIEQAGYNWIYNGSRRQGHELVPPEFKGAILVGTKAAAAKSTIGSILTALNVNHVFRDKVHVRPLYFHPLVVPNLLQQLGIEWETVLAWREANLTPEQLAFSPKRTSYSNPENGSNSSSENNTEERHVHMAARVEPQTARGSEVSALLERLQALDAKVASLQGAAAPSNSAGAGSSNSALAVGATEPQTAVPETSAAPAAPSPPVGLARAGSSKRSRD